MKVFLRMNYPHSVGDDKKESFGINTANTQLLVNLLKYSEEIEEFGLVATDPEEEQSMKELFPYRRLKGHVFSGENELISVLQYYDIFFTGGYGIRDILKCESFFNSSPQI